MAEKTSGSSNALAFVVGGLVVVVGILAYLFLGGDVPAAEEPDIQIELPDLPQDGG
ncbi:hypothetical protein [Poseidonocella sedimentorum]|uniref:Uncharacterized protein n=1 Tax=Poseidonocella sedimentorum TaxID=871652 RepID=A0A1I6CSJ4_9RHOB|nr:hypothetical protein [Poseidonocella sedimentorum]SFQ96158.1 hypothetical protein SAMN04515673_101297 [Poseidonocella sedimentorum]